jgi:opine dehydrogenase
VAWWPATPAVREAGALRLAPAGTAAAGEPMALRTPSRVEDALDGADAVVVDVPADRLLPFMSEIAAALPRNVVVHLQSHGYWPAARVARQAWAHQQVWADSSAPTHAATFDGESVTIQARRLGLRFSSHHGHALPVLSRLYRSAEAADCALETGLESINLMVHPGATVANLAALDRTAAAGRGFSFYDQGNTETAERLALALDAERGSVCRAYGVRHRGLVQTVQALYGGGGTTPRQAIADCPFYQQLGELPALAPAQWARIDLPYALIPVVRLGHARGLALPVHEGVIAVLSTAFAMDPWPSALTLDDLGVLP